VKSHAIFTPLRFKNPSPAPLFAGAGEGNAPAAMTGKGRQRVGQTTSGGYNANAGWATGPRTCGL